MKRPPFPLRSKAFQLWGDTRCPPSLLAFWTLRQHYCVAVLCDEPLPYRT
ncbi:hypothetical protein T02_4604, partial [Trichinella nativa]